MKILAGEPTGKAAKIAQSLGIGCMICTSGKKHLAGPRHQKFNNLAMDNGAFGAWANGRKWDGNLFLENVDRANKLDLNMLFVVAPDIMMGGLDSLKHSIDWRDRIDYPKVALVIQEGMQPVHVDPVIGDFQYVFLGGGPWKWRQLMTWVDFAHSRGLPIHVGQCGQLWMLQAAARAGVDSVDSTSWVVNRTWHIIKEFLSPKQLELKLTTD